MFTVEVDRPSNRIIETISGFLDKAAVDQMAREVGAAIAELRRNAPSFDMLVDLSGAAPGGSDGLGSIAELAQALEAQGVRRIAVVMNAGLIQLQAKRMMGSMNANIAAFETKQQAAAWLDEDTPKRAASA